jgi:hypothetical protein
MFAEPLLSLGFEALCMSLGLLDSPLVQRDSRQQVRVPRVDFGWDTVEDTQYRSPEVGALWEL